MRWGTVMIMLVTLVDAAGATSLQETFLRSVQKRALPNGNVGQGKWKALCVCNTNFLAGAIESGGGLGQPGVPVSCAVPRFDSAGNWAGTTNCYDWTPIPK